MKHSLLHILACALPLLLLFLLPVFGVSSGVTFTVFIVLMLGFHVLMMGGHAHEEDEDDSGRSPPAGAEYDETKCH